MSSETKDMSSQYTEEKTVKTEWKRPKAKTNIGLSIGRISEVVLLDSQCELLVQKRSLHTLPKRKALELFSSILRTKDKNDMGPYFKEEGIAFYYIQKNNIYLLAVHSAPECDDALCIVVYMDFLKRLYCILKECLGAVTEAHITANRMLVFEILDEVLTLGYGHVQSYSEIKPHLSFDPIKLKPNSQDNLATRFFGVNIADKSRRSSNQNNKTPNSAYINIVEDLSAVLGPEGQTLSCELCGRLTLISTLWKPCPILLQLNRNLIIKDSTSPMGQVAGSVHIERPNWHPCVDISQLPDKHLVRVMPPPEQTRLMVYTVSDPSVIRVPITMTTVLEFISGSTDTNFHLRLINQAERNAHASSVKIKIILPSFVKNVAITKADNVRQVCQFNPNESCVDWEIKKSLGGSEDYVTLRLIVGPSQTLQIGDLGPLNLTFNMTNYSASGFLVNMATVEVPSSGSYTGDPQSVMPQCFFGVSTKSASYSLRTSD